MYSETYVERSPAIDFELVSGHSKQFSDRSRQVLLYITLYTFVIVYLCIACVDWLIIPRIFVFVFVCLTILYREPKNTLVNLKLEILKSEYIETCPERSPAVEVGVSLKTSFTVHYIILFCVVSLYV